MIFLVAFVQIFTHITSETAAFCANKHSAWSSIWMSNTGPSISSLRTQEDDSSLFFRRSFSLCFCCGNARHKISELVALKCLSFEPRLLSFGAMPLFITDWKAWSTKDVVAGAERNGGFGSMWTKKPVLYLIHWSCAWIKTLRNKQNFPQWPQMYTWLTHWKNGNIVSWMICLVSHETAKLRYAFTE